MTEEVISIDVLFCAYYLGILTSSSRNRAMENAATTIAIGIIEFGDYTDADLAAAFLYEAKYCFTFRKQP